MADNYQVLSQSQGQELSPTGMGFIDVWHVTYKVTSGPAKGTVGTVTVPNEDHNADAVQAEIESKISDLGSIAGLGK